MQTGDEGSGVQTGDEGSRTSHPDDENLVQLSPIEGQQDYQRSYINASYIAVSTWVEGVCSEKYKRCVSFQQGYSEPKKFIATQGNIPRSIHLLHLLGPLSSTIVDLWKLLCGRRVCPPLSW